MKIGIISDTHDRLESLQQAMQIFRENRVEKIIHCGDWTSPYTLQFLDSITPDFQVPIYSVFGNNEGDKPRIFERNAKLYNPIIFSEDPVFKLTIDNKKIAIYHGQVKTVLNELIGSQSFDVVFTGHTHAVRNERIGNTLIFNPGSTSFAAEGNIINQASIGIYDSLTDSAQLIIFSHE